MESRQKEEGNMMLSDSRVGVKKGFQKCTNRPERGIACVNAEKYGLPSTKCAFHIKYFVLATKPR